MKKKIFILGELNVDLIFTGNDVTPEWNKEKLVDGFEQALGSSSAITASCLAGLGFDVYFVGVVGDDPFGHFCTEQLKKNGVNAKYVTFDRNLKTGVTLSLSTNVDRALLTYMGAIPKLHERYLPESLFAEADHIHFGSYFLQEEMKEKWKEIFEKAQKHSISTSFDTGWDPNNQWDRDNIIKLLEFTDFFIPSEKELFQILQINGIEDIIGNLPDKRRVVAVKRGAEGSVLIDQDSDVIKEKAFEILPVDTTGAGDSFNAGLIAGYLSGIKERELLKFANACGAMATLRIGGASSVPTWEQVEEFLHNHLS
ncbi:carbohydrate kinase family protein [Lederbergia citrea]|uniref:Carbohydrate kinase family protein n=1 Tax=Lederbergia citrea TaxID=2833581 RepID=A0A942UNZ3_9BACI|nr:carbohydrate kinase family protein [Lederbergia citrea]MBS4178594.1 carbohydrate kinase family protein [Lederbergia citrea]MBS4205282.1 carbohydrate kinase family protein [Lederbergia citrea]MBS4222857.1 carbohydrate kinase family protein [Lederbergia citrea]